jgi:hypothetical protein
MAAKIDDWAARWKAQNRLPGAGEFEELLLGFVQH